MTHQLFIVSAPSGAGKTSLVNALVKRIPDLKLSVSHTTRNKRNYEEEGVHYYFISVDDFLSKKQAGVFIESALVYGNWYGTSKTFLEQALTDYDVILEIDCQGAKQVCALFKNAVSIFIAPPRLESLHERLDNRGTDNAEVIASRLVWARQEMQQAKYFEFIIINDDLPLALDELTAVVKAMRLKSGSQVTRYPNLFLEE